MREVGRSAIDLLMQDCFIGSKQGNMGEVRALAMHNGFFAETKMAGSSRLK